MRRRAFLAHTVGALGAATFPARVLATGRDLTLANDAIAATFTIDDGTLRLASLADRLNRSSIPPPRELFAIVLHDGTQLRSSEFTVVGDARVETLVPDSQASRFADRLSGNAVAVELLHRSGRARVQWRALLRDGAHYVRQTISVDAVGAELVIDGVRMIDFVNLPDALVVGSVDGSPIVSGNWFLGIEHPFAQAEGVYDRASATLPYHLPLRPGVPVVVSNVIGVTRPGQRRRDFLRYVERERAHPYRTFLHYNSWYDIGYFTPYTADEAVSRIEAFGQALHVQRGVRLESFLFDDGWDDPDRLWQFNSGFRDGFASLHAAAEQYGAAPGAWLSPWGGYGKPHERRIASAIREGYETDSNGLALSGPRYYEYFTDVVTRFIQRGGVNQFKIDGTGDNSTVYPGSRFGSNFDAAIHLIETMRRLEPNIYVNLTTGTYPSPFWLRYCDSIWRGGYDHNFEGVGTHRQKWITYRDADTYAGIVTQGPLYPLNSLMLHGLIYAQHAKHLDSDPHGDFRDEIRSYFSTGTQLQEMYVTPTLLSPQNWNDLAQAAKWSAVNADVLCDTHWVGGNPARLDVYGWASWSARKGILALRNPSDRAQEIALDIGSVLEVPDESPREYVARSPWHGEAGSPLRLRADSTHLFRLQPFEVMTLELIPAVARR